MRKAKERFVAEWNGALINWAKKAAAKSLWKIFPLCDYDELMAEAEFCFSKCKERYESQVTRPAHFAALFRTTFNRRLLDLARSRTRRQQTGFSASELHPDKDLMDCFKGRYSASETAELLMDFEGAPAPVLSLLREILEGTPAETSRAVETADGYNACNTWLCRALGLPPETDLVGAFMAKLRPA